MAEQDEQQPDIENELEPLESEPSAPVDPARELLEGWGLRSGRTAGKWTLDVVSLDPHDPAACIDFTHEAGTARVRVKLASAEPSYGQVGPIALSHDVVDDALNVEIGDLLRLLVVWFKQRADTDALAALLQTYVPEPATPPSTEVAEISQSAGSADSTAPGKPPESES